MPNRFNNLLQCANLCVWLAMPHRCHSCQPAALNFLQHATTAWMISQPLRGSITAYTLWNPHGSVTPECVSSRETEQRVSLRNDGISIARLVERVTYALHSEGNVGWRCWG